MSLIQDIKSASLVARKARETKKAESLITLYSEASMIGKNDGNRESTDAETVAVIKKFIKNIDETLIKGGFYYRVNIRPAAHLGDPRAMKLIEEKKLLSEFLPKQLTQDRITALLQDIIRNSPGAKMGDVLKTLKAEFDGEYDGGLAAKIAKGLFA